MSLQIKRWISFKDLIAKWNIDHDRLTFLIIEGLPVYKTATGLLGPGVGGHSYQIMSRDETLECWVSKQSKPPKTDDLYFLLSDVREYETTYLEGESVTNQNKKPAIIPCPPGTRWDEIKITLISNDTVRIETPDKTGRYSYHELKMSDKRKGDKPTVLWTLLKQFAKHRGNIGSNEIKYQKNLVDDAKRLNKHLQTIFGIHETIYKYHFRTHRAYIMKIKFRDATFETEEDESNDSEHEFYNQEIEEKKRLVNLTN